MRIVADRPRRGTRPLLLLLGATLLVGVVRAAAPPGTANDPIVARVESKPIRLSEVQELRRRNQERYQKETGKAAPAAFDNFFLRAGLEEAIRMRLVELDARALGLTVSDAQAESAMKQDPFFRPGGKFDAPRFESYRSANPKSFDEAREQARSLLLYQRRMRGLERELVPPAGEVEQLARMRDLKARVRYVLVSDLGYDGVHDPTDEQLRAYYEEKQDELARPAELAFTAATVPLPSGETEKRGALARATELLASARSGAPFDSLLRVEGVVSASGVWRPGANSGLFAGNPGLAKEALALAAGSIVPELVETPEALAIVRVDRAQAGSAPSLSQIAVDLRARWRAQMIQEEETGLARAYFDANPDSFASAAWFVRWARVDSSQIATRDPKESELKTWFEGHRAEFARLDPSGGGIQMRDFAEVRSQVAMRWRQEERAREARRLADELASAWARGKDGGNARAVKKGGPAWLVAAGALPEDMPRVLADSVRAWDTAPRALVLSDPAGFAVVGLVRHEPRYRPSFEVVEPRARELAFDRKLAADRLAARDWYELHKERYVTGPGFEVVYALSPPPQPARIDIPGSKIERHYKEHASELGTPPEVHVRHILVMTDRRSDAEARALATRLLTRLRAGENFQALARVVSEDPGNKDQGGDLGFIRRGGTVPAFERAAFALTAAQPLSSLVRTQFGYHIIQLVERREGKVPPFSEVRSQIGQQLAIEYADTLARITAETLRKTAKDRADLLVRAEARKLTSQYASWYEGQPLGGAATIDELRADAANVAPGGIFPRIYRYLKQGFLVASLDKRLPPRQLSYEEARDRVLQEKQRERGIAAAAARADRLARELSAGMPWEQAIETVGGESVTNAFGRGVGLPTLGRVAGLDSLLFGPGADTLRVGGWKRMTTPRGDLFVQLIERTAPEAAQSATTQRTLVSTVLNRRMYDYVERLRGKYAVRVLRADLAERLPPPPEI